MHELADGETEILDCLGAHTRSLEVQVSALPPAGLQSRVSGLRSPRSPPSRQQRTLRVDWDGNANDDLRPET